MFLAVFITLVAVFNILVLINLKRRSLQRQKMTSSTEGDMNRSITRLIVGMATLFTIFHLPGCLLLVVTAIIGDKMYENELFNVISPIRNILLYANAACNFWLYCTVSRKFRQALREPFKCK